MISLQNCHLTKPAECRALVDLALREYGRIDVLSNNAAMACFNWLEDITNEEWNRDLREEIDLIFFLTRAAWPYLKASHGVVVNTASLNGLMSFKTLGSLAHTTAKAGIRSCSPRPQQPLVSKYTQALKSMGRSRKREQS